VESATNPQEGTMAYKLTLYVVTLLACACSTDRGEAGTADGGGEAGTGLPDATGPDAAPDSSRLPLLALPYDATLDCLEPIVSLEGLHEVGTDSPYNSPDTVCVISPQGDAYASQVAVSSTIEKDPSAQSWKVPGLAGLGTPVLQHTYSEFTAEEQALCSAARGALMGIDHDGGITDRPRLCPAG
jgi:hypothetical protein